MKKNEIYGYEPLVDDLKELIHKKQYQVIKLINSETINLYWEIGEEIYRQQQEKGWGKSIVQVLSVELQKEFPGAKGYSAANLWRMRNFYLTYRNSEKLAPMVREISWSNNIIIMEKCKDDLQREFYIQMTKRYGWTKRILTNFVEAQTYEKYLLNQTNFDLVLPVEQRVQAKLAVKDEYTFDFAELSPEYSEHELEMQLVNNIRAFLIEMGGDYTYIGNQYHLMAGNRDLYIDLLLFHRRLRTILNADINVLNNRIWDDFEDYINHFVLGIDENVSEDINAVEDIIERLANTNIELAIAVLDKEKVSWDKLDECCENNVEKEKKKEIWNYLLENSRISSTWKNFESYYNEFGITTEMSVWINENCSDIVKSEKTEKIDNDCIKSIIINSEITVQTVEQIADNYKCDEEIEFDVSKLPEDKIYVLIRKHYIRYSLSNTEKIKSNAIDGFGIYCREYIDQFINDLPSVSLNESEVVMLLNDTTIDKHFKPEILKKISAGIMTKKLAQTIASNQFDVDKVYVERAWKFLDNTERHMLLVYHLQVYSVAEISRLLMELGGEWSKLSDNKSRHKEEISIDVNGHNERLLLQLQKKGFITSYQEKNDRKKRCFEVWVKQQ